MVGRAVYSLFNMNNKFEEVEVYATLVSLTSLSFILCQLYGEQNSDRVRTLLSCSKSMTFHDFLHDLFKFSKTMNSDVSFKNSKTFPCFRVFFDLKQFNRHKLWCPPKCVPFTLFNHSFLSVHCPCLVICSN